MDRIELRGLRALGTHGALPEEQVRAQPFEVDLDVFADLAGAGRSDELADTIDYGGLAEAVARVVEGERHALLERMAERIAETACADPRVASVTVTVRKLRPPVPVDLVSAAVTITHVEAIPYSLPYRVPGRFASGAVERADNVLVRVRAGDGLVGQAEAQPRPYTYRRDAGHARSLK